MMKTKVKFDSSALSKMIFDNAVANQTELLIRYAKDTIIEIGNKILTYNNAHHMDRTGNLLNSLCWGVAYQNELKGFGFYREEPVYRPLGIEGSDKSYLHERSGMYSAFEVNGREKAQAYINRYGKYSPSGWRVFFAILAPYWGYWEEGFTMRSRYGERFMRFSVMSMFYDKVSEDLKPSNVNIKVYVDHYTNDYQVHFKRKGLSQKSTLQEGSLSKAYNRWDDKMNKRRRK